MTDTSTSPEEQTGADPAQGDGVRLWNTSFLLLWQGQLVSAMGDAVYAIALGFWILAVTGSTAMMGTLMAVSTLPRILVAPFAGVVVDRSDRKRIIVVMDAVRGLAILLVGLAAYTDSLQIWMVFVAGIIISLGSAFFNPSVSSIVPDIVPKSRLVQANSLVSMIHTGSGTIGNAAGGFLYALFGAPLMFLINGASYVFSAFTELFIRVPPIAREDAQWSFFQDMREGFAYIWNTRGLRSLLLAAMGMNFFGSMGFMLYLPLFQQQAHLGPELYGLFMGAFTGGMLLGYALTSSLTIKPAQRCGIFILCIVCTYSSGLPVPVFLYFPLMAGCIFIGGLSNAAIHAIIGAILQMTVPQDKRGKVFGLLGSMATGLMPIAFALGGVLGEVISVRVIIFSCLVINLFFWIALLMDQSFRTYLSVDPDAEGQS